MLRNIYVVIDKVYQLLAHGLWFSPASSTTKTGRHDIAEILLKVALKHNKLKKNKKTHVKPTNMSYAEILLKLKLNINQSINHQRKCYGISTSQMSIAIFILSKSMPSILTHL
jgi:hypothetical protein